MYFKFIEECLGEAVRIYIKTIHFPLVVEVREDGIYVILFPVFKAGMS